jgi:hypothetical protein
MRTNIASKQTRLPNFFSASGIVRARRALSEWNPEFSQPHQQIALDSPDTRANDENSEIFSLSGTILSAERRRQPSRF